MYTPVRWTSARKIKLLNEIRAGRLSPAEALVQFGIGPEELMRWWDLYLLGGRAALMAGQVQKYRQKPAGSITSGSELTLDPYPTGIEQ
ncbi:MAG: DUF1153 domain-containing protein [Candidatus Eremiobacteraeota bacterium]|nr:DUF1153 domain-containing protein [Candidatus Eremiobacteraeota bacterium]